MSIESAYQYLYLSAAIVLGILVGIVLIRSVIGPRITDRILCINMIGTLVICLIAILALRQNEGYLVDISLIYAMISFLTVLILASVYIRKKEGKPDERDDRPSSNRQIGEGGKEAGDG
jgi:multicomponent Na+:H+ antiporter subunit F